MISKVFIVPYFGQLPEWFEWWDKNSARMENHDYNFLFDEDEDSFRDRVRDKLGVEPPPMTNTGRVWNFRPAFGMLYEDEIVDFDFWGHTDFDVVYGQVEKWVTDEFLNGLDIHSNHDDYICGPWTLYRNVPKVNELFADTSEWIGRMEGEDYSHGWAEKGFSDIVDAAHEHGVIRRVYTKWQTRSQDDFSGCRLDHEGRLWDGDTEAMMLHFRRTKQYPKGCIL